MLNGLTIKNLILIEQLHLPFIKGLNILTGESGSGKTAIIKALSLLLGKKAPADWIRKGASVAIVEGSFSGVEEGLLQDLIPSEALGSTFLLRRELYATGKSRCFLDDTAISLATLRKIGERICTLVGQNTHLEIDTAWAKQAVDSLGELEETQKQFAKNFQKMAQLQRSFHLLQEKQQLKEKILPEIEKALHLIQEVDPSWEHSLPPEHHFLTQLEKVAATTESLYASVYEKSPSLLSALYQLCSSLNKILPLDPKLQELHTFLEQAKVHLEEASHFLRSYRSNLPSDTKRLKEIEDKMALWEMVKRKYGPSSSQLAWNKASLQEQKRSYEKLEDEILESREALTNLQKEVDQTAKTLSQERTSSAEKLQQQTRNWLQKLHLASASFSVQKTPQKRDATGDEQMEFWFSANPGEIAKPLQSCASGGELARVMLALQLVISEKKNQSLLILDEIDANIGGITAASMGKALKTLSEKKQVIAITHFLQVAEQADAHFLLTKKTEANETYITAHLLEESEKEKELLRMVGHSPLFSKN